MKKLLITTILGISTFLSYSQSVDDLFKKSDTKISWLGVDYSHVKLIGDFSQFNGAGDKSSVQMKKEYFPAWNHLILNEQSKYDIKGMLKKDNLLIDIDLIMAKNAKAATEEMETYNTPDYTDEDIKKFVKEYNYVGKEGLGVVFLAESLNKSAEEAIYHVVVINMKTNEIVLQDRIKSVPRGFGLRNYWAGSIYDLIKKVKSSHYKSWKSKYSHK